MNTLHSSNTYPRPQRHFLLPSYRRACPSDGLRPTAVKPVTQPSSDIFDGLKHAPLISFVQAVFNESECRRILEETPSACGVPVASPTRRLRAAAWSTSQYPKSTRLQAEVIYAATLILGLQNMLKAAADQNSGDMLAQGVQPDVFFSICRPALYRLESLASVHAVLLRIALNWGNQDEMLDEEAQRIQSIVRQASRVCAGRLYLQRSARSTANGEIHYG
jgi:hypothetical protein